jgi:hypothetical protein
MSAESNSLIEPREELQNFQVTDKQETAPAKFEDDLAQSRGCVAFCGPDRKTASRLLPPEL